MAREEAAASLRCKHADLCAPCALKTVFSLYIGLASLSGCILRPVHQRRAEGILRTPMRPHPLPPLCIAHRPGGAASTVTPAEICLSEHELKLIRHPCSLI